MKKILRVMKYLYENPEGVEESKLKEKFSYYDDFSRFCMGGEAYAQQFAGDKIRLTQLGVREYHRILAERKQQLFNFLMIVVTLLMAIFTGFSLLS